MIHSACDFKPFPHLLDHYCKQTSKPSNDHGFCFKNKVICCDEGLTLETPASETIDSTQFTLSLQIRKPTYRVIPVYIYIDEVSVHEKVEKNEANIQ